MNTTDLLLEVMALDPHSTFMYMDDSLILLEYAEVEKGHRFHPSSA
jgi:hypothetical protein